MNDKESPSKAELRDAVVKRRKLLSEDELQDMSAGVHARLREIPAWNEAREVMLYWRTRNEVDTRAMFEELRGRGVTVYLPRCREGSPGIMDAAPVSCATELREGKFSIMEPDSRICRAVEDCSPDLVMVPGVVFGRGGNRLGYGGGYYDRFLSRPGMRAALKVGVCFSFQLVPRVPADDWDQPVDVVVTEQETLWIAGKQA